MFCKNCGKALKENSEFCLECGYKVGNGTKHCRTCGKEVNGADLCLACGCINYPVRKPVLALNCTACNAPLAPSARFCPECGKAAGKQNLRCTTCGHEHSSDADVCVSCGHLLNPFAKSAGAVKVSVGTGSVKVAKAKSTITADVVDNEFLFGLGKKLALAGLIASLVTLLFRLVSSIFSFVLFDAFTKKNLDADAYFEQQKGIKALLKIFENPAMRIIYFAAALLVIAGFILIILSKKHSIKVMNLINLIVFPTFGGLLGLFIILSSFIASKGLYVTTLVFFCLFIVLALANSILHLVITNKNRNLFNIIFNNAVLGFALIALIAFIVVNIQYAAIYSTTKSSVEILVSEGVDASIPWYFNTSIFGPSAEFIGEMDYTLKLAIEEGISSKLFFKVYDAMKVTRISVLVTQILTLIASAGGLVALLRLKSSTTE